MLSRVDLEEHCLAKNGVTKSYPFDEKTAVFKLLDKMFLLFVDESEVVRFNVKCDPLYALELRTIYEAVIPGYHMSKKHWNTVLVDGEISDETLLSFIDDSYDIIFGSLTKKKQAEVSVQNP